MGKIVYHKQKSNILKRIVLFFSLILISYFSVNAAVTIFSDDFSGSYPGNWYIGHDGGGGSYAWAWPNGYAHEYSNPSGGMYYYPDNLHVYMERRYVNLSGYTSATLSFYYVVDTELGCDFFTVKVRDQYGNWQEMFKESGEHSLTWVSKTINLDQYAGQTGLYIQFRFDSDVSVSGSPYDGVYVENVQLTAEAPSPLPDLVSVSGIPTSISIGNSFTMSVTAENDGGVSPAGYISVSYTGNPTLTNESGSGLTFSQYPPGYYPIYDRYGNPITAQYLLLDAYDSNWTGTESHTMSVTVTPQQTGTMYIYVRTNLKDNDSETYYSDCSVSGGDGFFTDQQGWACRRFPVNVVGPQISSISPSSGPRGKIVTIYGSNFGDSRGSSYVKFGTIPVDTNKYWSWSQDTIVVDVPINASLGTVGVVVHTGYGDSDPKNFYVAGSPYPSVNISGIPDNIEEGESFTFDVTLSNDGGESDRGGLAISFPDLNQAHPGMSNQGPYDTSQARIETSSTTFPSSDIIYFDQGDVLADPPGSQAQHLLVDGDTGPFSGSKTITLRVTPKQISDGVLTIKIRGFLSVGGPNGYQGIMYRVPNSSGTGIQQDQQLYWAYVRDVTITSSPRIVDKSISTNTSRDGSTITVGYRIENPGAMAPIGLGCSIIDPAGKEAFDVTNDITIIAQTGTYWFYRNFIVNLPPGAQTGTYDVVWGIWKIENGARIELYETLQEQDILTIQAPNPVRIPILMYHKIGDTTYSDYWVTKHDFQTQMEALKAYGYTSITLQDLLDYRAGIKSPPLKPVLITFDDGYKNLRTHAYPVISASTINYKVTCFLPSGRVGGDNSWDAGGLEPGEPIIQHLTWDDVVFLHNSGYVDFQSHTVTHPHLFGLGDSILKSEFENSRKDIDNHLTGKTVKFIGWPFCETDPHIQQIAYEAGYFAGVTCNDEIDTTCENKWELKRVVIGRNNSVDFDAANPTNFFMTKIGDPDVKIPLIQIDSIEYLDPSTNQPIPDNLIIQGFHVKIRVTATNNGEAANVTVSLNLDSDSDHDNGVIYDSHPGGDIETTFATGQRTFDWTWTVPQDAPLGQYYVAIGFHDQYYVLGYAYSGWQEALNVLDDGISWQNPHPIVTYNIFGHNYELREYEGGTRLVVFQKDGTEEKLVTDSSLIAALITYHAFKEKVPDLNINMQGDIQNASTTWEDIYQKDYEYALKAAHEYDEVRAQRLGLFQQRTFITAAGTVASAAASLAIVVVVGIPTGGVGSVLLGTALISMGLMSFTLDSAGAVMQMKADEIGDEFVLDERVAWLKGIAFLDGDTRAREILDQLRNAHALADSWERLGETYSSISDALTLVQLIAGATNLHSLPQVAFHIGDFGYKTFVEKPVTLNLDFHMDINALKLRIEHTKVDHLEMLWRLASQITTCYKYLDKAYNYTSTADDFGRKLLTLALAKKLFLENKYEYDYSLYFRLYYWAKKGYTQGAYEFLDVDLTTLYNQWDSDFTELDVFTDKLADFQELYQYYSGLAQLSYQELGKSYLGSVDVLMQNEGVPVEIEMGSLNTIELTAINLSGQTLSNMELSLSPSDNSGIILATTPIGSVPIGGTVLFDCGVQFPASQNINSHSVNCDVILGYDKDGEHLERHANIKFLLTLPFSITDIKPDKVFPGPGDEVNAVAYLVSKHNSTLKITPSIYFSAAPELYTVILPQQTISCSNSQKNECPFTWSGITAGMPKGVYAIRMEVEKSDGTEFEFDIPTFVYVIPEVNGDLAMVDLNNATIITPRADIEEGNKISKRIQNAFNIPDSHLYILDEHQGDLEILKRKDNLVLIGGNMANDLVADLIGRGKLPGNLWQKKGDAVVYVIEDPFYPLAPQGYHAVVVAGTEIDDTYIAGISMIKHWQDMNQLDHIEIKGHTEVFENSWIEYDCIAYYTDGTQREITPQWQVDSTYAEISMTGLLKTQEVPSDQPCQISATYGESSVIKTDISQITIKDIPPGKVLNQIVIEGPSEVDENTSQDFNCRAYYSDGTNQPVEPQWIENSTYTEISSTGLLTASYITSDQPCQITAAYNEGGISKSDFHDITIKDRLTFIPQIERMALIALYNSTNGDYWTNNSSWKEGELEPDGFGPLGSEINWYGIEILNGHVVRIYLGNNNLQGTIPPEIGNLPNLHTIYMDHNQLSGNISPQFGSLSNLANLYLNANQLTGIIPTELGNLSELSYLDLSSNQLDGSIPVELGNMGELDYLDLSDNRLSGTIPPELSNPAGGIYYLDLSSNQLNGNIPKELGSMSSLDYFDLSSNRLSGSIPVELANIGNLNHFDIGYNALYSQDADLRAFLGSNDPDWENTQTVAPVGISANATSSSSVEISWTPINYTNNNGGYKVFYSINPGGPWIEAGITENKTVSSYDVFDLDADMTYYFVVKTQTDPHDNNQNTVLSEESDEVSATTLPAPKILDHIIIEGPPAIDENSNQEYNCRAYYTNGTHNLVEPSWSEDSQYAEISTTGLLNTLEVVSHQPCQISASYTEGEISVNNILQIVIKDTTPNGMVYVNGTTGDDGTGERNNPGKPFKTIQSGINAAMDGDMVSVTAGTYIEHLILKSGIRLNGSGAENTIIAGGGSGTLILADNIHSTAVTGFTFTNGGKLEFVSSSCSLQNCIIENCQNGQYQGIVMIRGTEGITSDIDIRNNIFRNNRADYGSITLEFYAHATIRNNIIVNNEISDRPYDKGVIDLSWGYNMGPVSADVVNNVIAGNVGGGIYAENSSTAPHSTIVNNIIVNNSGFGIVAIYDDVYMDYNNIWNNGEGNYRWGISPGIHDISQEPLFKGGYPFDYHLEVGSPCIDTGHPFILDPDGSRSDMGAYGSTSYIGDISAPRTHSHNPARGESGVSPTQNIVVQISDDSSGVNQTSIKMRVNGVIASPEISGTPTSYTLTYNPPEDFVYGQTVAVTVNACDLASPPNVMTEDSYSFTVIAQANRPPYVPDNPIPRDGIISHYIYGNMYWGDGEASPDDPDEGDVVTFHLYLDTNSDPQTLIWSGQSSHQRYYAALENNTKYYWKIIAEDKHGAQTEGPVWSFTTEPAPTVITSPLAIIEEFDAPASDISGITWDGNNIWTCDQTSRNIYKHNNDSSLSVERVYDDPNPGSYFGPSGMAWDGVNLWYCAKNYGTMEIHKLDQNLSIIESKFGYQIDAIVSIGQEILSGSSWEGRIYNINNPFEPGEIYDFGWQSDIYGMAWDGNYLWVAIDSYLFKCGYDVSNPLYTNISQLERYTFGERIGGLGWDGYYLLVACPESDKIYKIDPTCTLMSIDSHPQSKTIVYNSSTILNVLVSGTEPFTYQWYEGSSGDTSNPVGENSNTFNTPNLTQTTSYWVRISNSCSSVDSETATITVHLPSDSEIRVTENSIEISSGGSYNFETTAVGTSKEKTFTIENLGTENLILDNLPLQITGTNSDQFSVVQQPGLSTITPNGHTTFALSFLPATLGSKTAIISIDNNDTDENPYNITLNGTGSEGVDSIIGRVINSSGNGIQDVEILVYDINYDFISSTSTNSNGDYALKNIPEGSYKLFFGAWNTGYYINEWYNDKGSFDQADVVSVAADQTTTLANAVLALGGIISGQVTDGSTGIENVIIRIYDEDNNHIGNGWTDSNGDYIVQSLLPGNYKVYFDTWAARNYISEWYNDKGSFEFADPVSVSSGQTTALADAVLIQGGIISGRVTDGSTGIEDVYIVLFDLSEDYISSTNSNSNGDFTFSHLTTGSYKIMLYSTENYLGEWYNDKNDFNNADQVSVTAGQTTTLSEVVLTECGIIIGRVTDGSTGIENVIVRVYDQDNNYIGNWWTDSSGDYILQPIPPGNYKVYFDSWQAGNYISEWYNDKGSLEAADLVSVSSDQTITLVDAILAVGGIINGRVTDGTIGIENVRVRVYDLDYNSVGSSVYTDSNGNYILSCLTTGSYKIRFFNTANYTGEWYNDKGAFETADAVAANLGQTTTLVDVILAEGGSISGRVTDSQGNGIESVYVNVRDLNNNYLSYGYTDSNGDYIVQAITAGSCKVYFNTYSAGNYISEWYNDKGSFNDADVVVVTVGQNTTLADAVLDLGGAISGRVTDGTNGIYDILIEIYDLNDNYLGNWWTDSNGDYTINSLPAGSYKVYFDAWYAGNYLPEWYDDKGSFADADSVSVTVGQTTILADAVLAEGGIISGRVTDGTNGIENVRIRLYDLNNSSVGSSVYTNSSGYYTIQSLPNGNYKVRFYTTGNFIGEWYNDKSSSNDADIVSVTIGQTTTLTDAVLAEGGIITGRVTDSQGNGISNVYVSAYDLNYYYLSNGYTDSNGDYTVQAIPSGEVKLSFDTNNAGNYVRQWYNNKRTFNEANPVSVTAGQTTTVNVQLADGGSISGTVTDGSNGIAQVWVSVYDLSYNSLRGVYTDSSGSYTVQGLPGENCKVYFDTYYVNTYYGGNYVGEWYNDKSSFSNADQVAVTVGQTTSGIDAVLVEGGSISGRVTDSQGNGIANVDVNVYDLYYSFVNDIYTDSNGYYTIKTIPGGNHKVYFQGNSAGNYISEWYNDKGDFDTADEVTVTTGTTTTGIDAVLMEGGSICGQVTDGTSGIQGVYIILYDFNYNSVSSTYSDNTGHYCFVGIIPGSYKVRFYRTGNYIGEWYNDKGDFYTADEVVVVSGQTTPGIDAALVQGGSICGRVSDGTNGIENILIGFYDLNYNPVSYAYSDSNGDYCFPAVPPGSYKVEFETTGSYFGEWYNDKKDFYTADEVNVISGTVTSGIDAVLVEGGGISGRVIDSQGNGIAGVSVYAYDLNYNNLGYGYTDNNGYYTAAALPAGNFKVFFRGNYSGNYLSEWYNDKNSFEVADTVSVTLGQTTALPDVVLTGGGCISGRVTAANGSGAIEHAYVRAYDMCNGMISRAFTDSNGNYTLQGIPTGDYKVTFYTSGDNYIGKWYNDKTNFDDGDLVSVTVGNTTGNIDAALESGGFISGNITDTLGKPIANLDIGVYDLNGNALAYGYSDQYGNYQVQAVPQGPCKVIFDPYSLNFYPQYYGFHNYAYEWYNDTENFNEAEIIEVTADQVTPGIDAVISEGGKITGQITDESGNGIGNILVMVYKDNTRNILYYPIVESHADGVYEVNGLRTGNYLVVFRGGKGFAGEFYNDVLFESDAVLVPVTIGTETSGINAVLRKSGLVTGRVTDADGNGIANVSVRLYDSIRNEYLASIGNIDRTDTNGYYTIFNATPGNRKVLFDTNPVEIGNFISEFYNDKQGIDNADIIPIQSEGILAGINAVLSTGGGTLSGFVTDINGIGLGGAYVEIYNSQFQAFAASGYTNNNGYFEIKGLIPGQYKVFTSLSNIYPSEWYCDKASFPTADAVTIANGGNTQIQVILGDGEPSTSLNITSPNGSEILMVNSRYEITWESSGIENVIIECSSDGGKSWWTIVESTPSDGSYDWTVTGEPSGNCLMRISASDADAGDTDVSDAAFSIVSAPVMILKILSPNGGEKLNVGSNYPITWASNGAGGDIKIEYSINNGASWIPIAASTTNDGSYQWTVPDTPSESCLVRISESDKDAGISDISDGGFSIVAAPFITITSPKGGESWEGGTTHPITWTSTGVTGNVMIEYSINLGTSWTTIAAAENTGSFNWSLAPVTQSETFMVRVSESDGSPSDTSEAFFIVPAPFLTVTSPNGGENWNAGTIHNITWTSSGAGDKVAIDYSVDNGTTWMPIGTSLDNNGSFPWTLPGTPSDNCLVRIKTSNADRELSDTGDAKFAIVPAPVIAITSPNGGERLNAGSAHDITWTCNGTVGEVKIEYSLDNGGQWTTIVPTTANDGSHSWTVPENPSKTCRVRISESDGEPADISDGVFSIVTQPTATLTVTSPNGGEQLTIGTTHTITWTSTGMQVEDSVIIHYSIDNGGTWTTIEPPSRNTGSYPWKVPGHPTENGLIRLTAGDTDDGPADVSDALFSIVEPSTPTITVTSPNGGEILTAGTTHEITWTAAGMEKAESIIIEYSNNNGTSWTAIAFTTSDVGSSNWTVPDEPAENCLVRIRVSDVDEGPSDVSDEVFAIITAPTLKVTSPNGGEQWKTGSSYNITWTYEQVSGNIVIDLYRGSSFDLNIGTAAVETGNFNWTIPVNFTLGNDYKILLHKDTTEDYSDAEFSIIDREPNQPDFNNDGYVDILWRNYATGNNEVWLMNGAQHTGTVELPAQPDLNWRIVGTGDFNRDGKVDILWRNYATGQNLVWYMDGTTQTGSAYLLDQADVNWQIAGTGDFNGDGKIDILWRNPLEARNQVWLLDGIAVKEYKGLPSLEGVSLRIAGIGDFNGDSQTDILWRNYTTGSNEVWFMNGTTRISTAAVLEMSDATWRIVGTGDFNHDGERDILWRSYFDGKNMIWTMDGITRTGYEYIETRSDLNWRIAGNGDYRD